MSEKSLTLRLALLAVIVSVSATPVFGQAFYGPFVGTVTYQSNNKNIFAARNYRIDGGLANPGVTYSDGSPATSALGNLVNMAPSPDSISEFRVVAGLAIGFGQTIRRDVNPSVGTVRATVADAARAPQLRTGRRASATVTDSQVINNVPNVTQNPLFCTMLQNGVPLCSDTSTSTLGDR